MLVDGRGLQNDAGHKQSMVKASAMPLEVKLGNEFTSRAGGGRPSSSGHCGGALPSMCNSADLSSA